MTLAHVRRYNPQMSYRFNCHLLRWLPLFLVCLAGTTQASTDGWISSTPLPSDVVITDMDCRADGLCVAIGLGGSILTSSIPVGSADGMTWTRQNTHTMHRLYDVFYAGPTQGFWVVGEGGVILQGSNDGLTWTHRDSSSRKALFSIASGRLGTGAEVLVAVGQQGVILVSQDLGVTWARPPSSGAPTIFPSFSAVGFFTDRFIAVGSSSAIVESADGLTWQEALDDQGARLYVPTLGPDFNEITVGTVAGVTRYAVVGEGGVILTSDDGLQWTTRKTKTVPDQELQAVTWDGGQFVAVGAGGRMATSPDGIAWSDQTALLNARRNIVEVHWDATNSRYLAAGTLASSGNFTGGFIKYSDPNSLSGWNPVSSGSISAIFNAITALDATQGNAFIAVGSSGLVLRSGDGNAWVPPTTSPATATGLTAVTASGANVIAVSDTGQAYASADGGLVWTGPIATTTVNVLNAVTTDGAGAFVAVGDAGTVVVSADSGATWAAATSTPSTTVNLTGIAWSPSLGGTTGGLYAATGISTADRTGTLWTSADGTNWTAVTTPQAIVDLGANNELYAIAWADNRFIAVGMYGLILYSTDGTHWTGGRAVEIAGSLYGVGWDGANIVVVGTVSAGVCSPTAPSAIAIYMSNDRGGSWTGHEKLGCETLFGAAWNGSQYVAAGQNGLLLASGGLDTAVNPLLNASVDTLSASKLPTLVASGVATPYPLTVTNNGNLDVPANAVQLAMNFAAGSQFIWGGATITVNNTTEVINCDAVTNQLRPVCTIPVALNVFPLPRGSAQTNRPKEGVDVTVTVTPIRLGDLTVDFEVLTPGVSLTDQNLVNNTLHLVTSVVPQKEIICSPDQFLSGCVPNVSSGSGSGGGAFGWWGLLLAVFASGFRRFRVEPGV